MAITFYPQLGACAECSALATALPCSLPTARGVTTGKDPNLGALKCQQQEAVGTVS